MSITELARNSPCYGITRYFLSDRCRNTDGLRQFNRFGLVGTYREAVAMQLDLDGKYPEESHADCEIMELWRRLT